MRQEQLKDLVPGVTKLRWVGQSPLHPEGEVSTYRGTYVNSAGASFVQIDGDCGSFFPSRFEVVEDEPASCASTLPALTGPVVFEEEKGLRNPEFRFRYSESEDLTSMLSRGFGVSGRMRNELPSGVLLGTVLGLITSDPSTMGALMARSVREGMDSEAGDKLGGALTEMLIVYASELTSPEPSKFTIVP